MTFADLVQKCRGLGQTATLHRVRATSVLPPQSGHALTRLARQFRANKNWLVRQPLYSDFRRRGGEQVVGRHRTPDALKFELPNGINYDGILDCHQDSRTY